MNLTNRPATPTARTRSNIEIPGWRLRAKARMKELGLTHVDLMAPLGQKTAGGISHFLSGRCRPYLHQLEILAQVLQMSLEELLFGRSPSPVALVATGALGPVGARGPVVEARGQAMHIDVDLLTKVLLSASRMKQRKSKNSRARAAAILYQVSLLNHLEPERVVDDWLAAQTIRNGGTRSDHVRHIQFE